MATVDDIKLNVSIEALVQKDFMDTVEKVYKEHGLTIESVSFNWVRLVNGKRILMNCSMESSLNKE